MTTYGRRVGPRHARPIRAPHPVRCALDVLADGVAFVVILGTFAFLAWMVTP